MHLLRVVALEYVGVQLDAGAQAVHHEERRFVHTAHEAGKVHVRAHIPGDMEHCDVAEGHHGAGCGANVLSQRGRVQMLR
jgi:hypothetical protein